MTPDERQGEMARGARPRIEVSPEMHTRITDTARRVKRQVSTVLDRAVMAALDVVDPGWAERLKGKAREAFVYYRHHSKRDKRDFLKRNRATLNVSERVGKAVDDLADAAGTTSGGWLDAFINECLDKEQPDGVQRHDPQPL
jgi:hypothetical protein